MIIALLIGLGLGFVGSMPIAGPTAVLVLERGLSGRRGQGMLIAVGAAVAESVYAFLAFWGFGALVQQYPGLMPASRLLGAVILVAIGLTFARKPHSRHAPPDQHETGRGRGRGLLLGLSVTALNPTLIANWAVVVTAVHSTGWVKGRLADALAFALGVGTGIVLWFTVFLRLLRKFQQQAKPETTTRIVRLIGWIIVAAGLALLVRAVLLWNRR